MLDLSTFVTFYAALLVIQLSPGPDMLLVIGRGVGQGRRTAFMSAIGMTLVAGFYSNPPAGARDRFPAPGIAVRIRDPALGRSCLPDLAGLEAFGWLRAPRSKRYCHAVDFRCKGSARGRHQQPDKSQSAGLPIRFPASVC